MESKLLAFAIFASALAHALQLGGTGPKLPRFVSYVGGTLGDVEATASEMLARQGDLPVSLDAGQGLGGDMLGGDIEAAQLARVGAAEWVHVATTFAELVAARRAGATTVWLNEQAAGKLVEAVEMLRKSIAVHERVLGAEHPHTLTCMDNLTYCLTLKVPWLSGG